MNTEVFVAKRKALKLSQVKLCAGICTQATLSKFENGSRLPSLTILTKLCARMGFGIEVLYQPTADGTIESAKKLAKVEQSIMIEDYPHALEVLDQVDQTVLDSVPLKLQYYYLRGVLTTLINGKMDGILFDFSVILNELDISHRTVFTVLAFLGSGILYDRHGKTDAAAFYFNKVRAYLSNKNEADRDRTDPIFQLRLLMMVYYTAAYYTHHQQYQISQSLIDMGISLCATQHMTYYLPSLKFLAAQNAVSERQPTAVVQTLIADTLAFAKINGNEVIEVKIAALKRRIEEQMVFPL
ncbi:helix-turn-helix domain-containing protein [Secundilactobacillus kimchicus]|uniref:helix-turn-helix domain-containing protein n=1 Tax=Secundilactobacillus kimchicus TaxID=528209 RepID=UPI0024A8FDC9|nr:helix-turn-helix transcriptional regulator [Secundilactobacillus kimchicus]